MGIKFGEVDSNQILENEFRIGVLERLLEYLLNNNSSLNKPSQQEVEEIKRNVVKKMKNKYPNSGIDYKN